MDTREYKTRTMFKEIQNPVFAPDKWCIGLDIGYSGVKSYGQNSYSCFPAFAVENSGSTRLDLGYSPDDHLALQYKDEDGVIWNVGQTAQDSISASDTSVGSLSNYGRHRYYSPMFKVLFRTGLAQCLRKNQYGDPEGKRLLIQTGLPPKYLKSDQYDFTSIMLGRHHFWVKFGMNDWQEFDFELTEKNLMPIIAQPMGTMISIATARDFKQLPDAANYFNPNTKVLIMDGGFGTLDFFPMIGGQITMAECETDENLGMKRVLNDTANEILDKYHFEVSVPAMQQYLETGNIPARVGRAYKNTPFNDILEKHSREVCYKAIEKLLTTYSINEYRYLVLTGGTCAAWGNFIRDYEVFKESDTIKVIPGNQGDPSLPYLFANVRGYYIYALVNSGKIS